MTSPLPTPRQLLTSILTSLASIPHLAAPHPATQPTNPSYDAPSNPLKLLPASHRNLLTTLHVLLPPPTLLQALDLLDRGLVTRLVLQAGSIVTQDEAAVAPPQANIHLPDVAERDGERERVRNRVYQVRSSQTSKGRFKDVSGLASSAMVYTVHLEAWNCSCAAFAFSAFPGGEAAGSWDGDGEGMEDLKWEEQGEGKWEFGGVSLDGRGGGHVPVCKHLLACLLGELWAGVLGGYVREREVGIREREDAKLHGYFRPL